MNKFEIKKSVISLSLTVFVIALIMLSGPAAAVVLTMTQPNDAVKGADVSFSTTVDIKDPDILPVSNAIITITGPGLIKTCTINNDGTDDCPDVDFTITRTNLNSVSSGGYGYDAYLGTGYNLGTSGGYQSAGGIGTITYAAVWHTSSTITEGTYTAKADIVSTGHTFSSSQLSFLISTPSAPPTNGGGGGGGNHDYTNREITVPAIVPTPVEQPVINPVTPAETVTNGETTPTTGGITGAAILNNIKSNPIAAGAVAVLVLGLIGYAIYFFRRK